MTKQLEDVRWLAALINTSTANTYYLISTGRIPGVVRFGPRMTRIDPEVVLPWIEAGGFVADEVESSRRAQQLGERITDEGTLSRVASHLEGAER